VEITSVTTFVILKKMAAGKEKLTMGREMAMMHLKLPIALIVESNSSPRIGFVMTFICLIPSRPHETREGTPLPNEKRPFSMLDM
jgi:hypothetical protein